MLFAKANRLPLILFFIGDKLQSCYHGHKSSSTILEPSVQDHRRVTMLFKYQTNESTLLAEEGNFVQSASKIAYIDWK